MTGDTSGVNAINLQVFAEDQAAIDQANGTYDANVAADSRYYSWQGTQQTIPMGMDGDPEGFAAALRTALPEVNTLRLAFNAWSFNADGTLSDQYARFVEAAAQQGFHFVFVYSDGEVQRMGAAGDMTSGQVYDALAGEAQTRLVDTWHEMLNWTAAHPDVADAVYGYEVMNEPAAYSRGADLAAPDLRDQATTDFVGLYTAQVTGVAQMIEAQSNAHVLIDGWNYAARFDVFADTMLGTSSALDQIRAGVGDALVWSSHFYPGWYGTDQATSGAEVATALADAYAPLAGDAILMTETNMLGSAVYDPATATPYVHAFAQASEWMAAHGIGAAWFPGAETGASNFVVVDDGGVLRFLHQESYAAGMNLFSLGEEPADHATAEVVPLTLIEGTLRNEVTDGTANAGGFDAVTYLGTAFGFGGNDTLQGSDQANNFLYGGSGNDVVIGAAHDDFLYGQGGDDSLAGGAGHDLLFGGDGADTLVAGSGGDILEGGAGADHFVLSDTGNVTVSDFTPGEGDTFDFGGLYPDFAAVLAHAQVVALNGPAANDAIITNDNGTTVTFLDVGDYFATDTNVAKGVTGTFDGTALSERIEVGDVDVDGEVFGQDVFSVNAGYGNDTIVGGDGNDTINGDAGNDVIGGGRGADLLMGGDGNDSIAGQRGNNQIYGGAGDDTLNTGNQSSVLFGGDGNDVLVAKFSARGFHTLVGGAGYDLFNIASVSATRAAGATILDFDTASDRMAIEGVAVDFNHLAPGLTAVDTIGGVEVTIAGAGSTVTLMGVTLAELQAAPDGIVAGTDGADLIDASYVDAQGDFIGNPNPFLQPVIDAGAGDDTVVAATGDDLIYGGAGNDTIQSASGNDSVYGGAGDDTIASSAGHNLLSGGDGNDSLSAGASDSTLMGGEGHDVLAVLATHDGRFALTGGAGGDVFDLIGEAPGSAAHLVITDFTAGEDRLRIDGTTLDLSSNDASVTLTDSADGVIVTSHLGGSDVLLAGLTTADLAGTSVTDGMVTVSGTDAADLIDASFVDAAGQAVSAWDDVVLAGAGNDTIVAGAGEDRLFGGLGDDRIEGGSGNNMIDGGDGADTLIGSHGDNLIFGGAGDDLIYSGRDASTVDGGTGNDTLNLDILRDGHVATGGAGEDSFIFSTPRDDRISHSVITDFDQTHDHLVIGGQEITLSYLMDGLTGVNTADGFELTLGQGSTILLEGLSVTISATPPDETAVMGTAGADTIDGAYVDASGLSVSDWGDVVRAGGGDDSIVSGAGNDSVYGDSGNDIIYLGTGDDLAQGGTGNDTIYGQNGHNEIYGGGGDDFLLSGRQGSTLDGGDGNDHLYADIYVSGHVLTGGQGADEFEFTSVRSGRVATSEVTDFSLAEDSLVIAGQHVDLTALPDGLTGHDTAAGFLLDLGGGSTILFDGLIL